MHVKIQAWAQWEGVREQLCRRWHFYCVCLKRSWDRRKREEQGREGTAAVHTQCGSALQGEIQEGIPHSGCGKETMGLRWLMKCPFRGSIHSVYISFLVF